MRISQTGIRSYEIITSSASGTQNKGTVIQVKGFYPPADTYVRDLDDITLRDAFNHFDFFSGMNTEQRRQYLIDNSTNAKDLYMEDVDLQFKFIKIGGAFFTKSLTSEQVNMLLKDNPNDEEGYWPVQEVYNMFPRKANSKAAKHTLIFRPGNWSLMTSENNIDSFTGLYLDLDSNEIKQGNVNKPIGGYLREFKLNHTFAITHNKLRTTPLSWNNILTLIDVKYHEEMNKIKQLLDWFPQSLFKSLLQKLIRTRCQMVSHNGEYYNSVPVLLTTLIMLMLHAGAFVPNIQRFVTGLESVCKRLAISICEDSFIDDSKCLVSLFGAAAIAQQDRAWQPTDKMISCWLKNAILAQQDKRSFQYTVEKKSYSFDNITELSFCHLLLSEIKSFESDINMVGSIAENKGKARNYIVVTEPLKIMPLIHCVDQHVFTDIAYYMSTPVEGFGEVFSRIWQKSSGVNPRNIKYEDWKEDEEIREAQRLTWLAKTVSKTIRENIGETIDFEYVLDESWLAGLIDPMEIKVGYSTAIVVVRPDNIYSYTAIRRPSRDNKAELSEEEKSAAINNMKLSLSKGLLLRHIPSTLPWLKGAIVYLIDEEYWLKLSDGILRRWEDIIRIKFTFPIIKFNNPSIEQAILYDGEGIMEGADQIFDKLLVTTDKNILNRLAIYLQANNSVIEMFKISRDGSGVDYDVKAEDVGVHNFLCQICCLYPAALVKTDNKFKVKCGPLLWSLRDKLLLSLRTIVEVKTKWPLPELDDRLMWDHQKDILQSLINRHEKGLKGHLIWATVGSGKTLCLTSYINYLIRKGDMSQYCVYTLPPSAVQAIIKELELMKIPYQLIDMRAGKNKNQTILPAMVNLVHHDHMRMNGFDTQMKDLAGEMLFVVDEFHKTMAKTIRTSITLEIVKLSKDFISMTGTLIKGDNPEELINWLSLIVEFEVTTNNYFVTLSALISKKINTKIVVERDIIEAKLLDEKLYYSLVPKNLGGTSDILHFREALRECYRAITIEMIEEAMYYINQGEKIFMIAKDSRHQEELQDLLIKNGVKNIFLITKNNSIVLEPKNDQRIKVVITTFQRSEGYSLADRRIAISCVCLSNQCTRDQLDGRLNRINQLHSTIRLITVHAGILSYIMKRYENARNLAEAIRGFAQDISYDNVKEIRALL